MVHQGNLTVIVFAVRNGRSFGREPFDDEVLDDEDAGHEPGREPADVHRPLHVVRAFPFRALAQPRARDRGDRGRRSGRRRSPGAPRQARNSQAPDAAARCVQAVAGSVPAAGLLVLVGHRSSLPREVRCYSITARMRPASTEVPGVTHDLLHPAGAGARSSFSIFIASTTTTPCRAPPRRRRRPGRGPRGPASAQRWLLTGGMRAASAA